jgi:hypothetical protein
VAATRVAPAFRFPSAAQNVTASFYSLAARTLTRPVLMLVSASPLWSMKPDDNQLAKGFLSKVD